MQVFPDEWIQETKRRYERLPDYQRPGIYFLAATENGEIVRTMVEEWVASLPELCRYRG